MQKVSKRHAAVAAGLTAILALTPIAAPASIALADDNDTSSAAAATTSVTVGFKYQTAPGTWTTERQASDAVSVPNPPKLDGYEEVAYWRTEQGD